MAVNAVTKDWTALVCIALVALAVAISTKQTGLLKASGVSFIVGMF